MTTNVATRCVLRAQNAFAVGAPPRSSMGKLTALPQTTWLDYGRGGNGVGTKGKGKKEGKGKEGEGREEVERDWWNLGRLLPGAKGMMDVSVTDCPISLFNRADKAI